MIYRPKTVEAASGAFTDGGGNSECGNRGPPEPRRHLFASRYLCGL